MRMMQQIQEVPTITRMTARFNGYNHRDVIADGEMYDTNNMCDDQYPVLSVRKKRGITTFPETLAHHPSTLLGICGGDKLSYIKKYENDIGDFVEGQFIYNGEGYTYPAQDYYDAELDVTKMPKQIIGMGAYMYVWPDKKRYSTLDHGTVENLEVHARMTVVNEADPETIPQIQMCKKDGEAITVPAARIKASAPKNPTNGMYWIDTSNADKHVLRQYASATKEWVEIPTVYVKITKGYTIIPNQANWHTWGYGIKEYDTIEISDLEAADSESATVKAQVAALNGSKIVYGVGKIDTYTDYIIIEGMLDVANPTLKDRSVIKIDRNVPDLDYIIESNNRLWGCKFGTVNGKTVNEIYACKLGDPTNWSCFMGLSTDSYTMSLGSEGPFTGAITQRGVPIFFKDHCIHKITGTSPSSFQLETINCKGVQSGSWRSVQILNETVYYKSTTNVMAFDGNMPYIISDNLGDVRYSDARAGVLGDKYYISMKNSANEWNLFVYNTRNGLWYREDNLKALGFGTVGDELFAIDETNNTLVSMMGTVGTKETDVEWRAEFGLSGVEYEPSGNGLTRSEIRGSHYLSRFDIRMQLEEGGKAELEIMYDSSGFWEKKGEIRANEMRTYVLPVVPKRCDHLRFRIKGNKQIKVYSISRIMEVGSDG